MAQFQDRAAAGTGGGRAEFSRFNKEMVMILCERIVGSFSADPSRILCLPSALQEIKSGSPQSRIDGACLKVCVKRLGKITLPPMLATLDT